MVVDDEPMIVDGLCLIIEENDKWGLDVHRACRSRDALAAIQEASIDIVITDISMPELSGLELLGEIRKRRPSCKVVLLTAHDLFEYAYEALKIQGVRFLLKTEDYAAVLGAIDGCVKDIEEDRRMRELAARSDEQMRLIKVMQRREYLRKCLRGQEKASQAMMEELGSSLDARSPIRLILGRKVPVEQTELIPSLLAATDERIRCEMVELDFGDACFAAQLAPEAASVLMHALEEVQDSGLSFALSMNPVPWESSHFEYKRLKTVLARAPEEGGIVCSGPEEPESIKKPGDYLMHAAERCRKEIEGLQAYIEAGNPEEFRTALSGALDQLRALCETRQRLGSELTMRMNLFFLAFANRTEDSAIKTKRKLREFAKSLEPDILLPKSDYMEFGEEVLEILSESKQMLKNASVERVKAYVDSHLGDDISLSRLAEVAHFNPKYLSKLFSSETGINLSEYIAGKRLEEAKRLIALGSMRMQDISSAVGFFSPAYFTRFFKKATGMSPQQYKERL
jgi:two-component system response regulator YesN